MFANATSMDYSRDSFQMSSLPITKQPRLSPSFHIADILGLNQAMPVTSSEQVSPSDQQCPPRNRRRRTRTIYTREQLASMEDVFASNQYPDVNLRDALADVVDLTEARVQVWFQNRRASQRRQRKRQTDTERDTDSVSSCNTVSSDSSSHPPTFSSTASTPSSTESSSPPSSPKSCSGLGSNLATPPTKTSNSNNLSDCKTPTVPSPPSSGPCTLTCCSPPSIHTAYPSLYTSTPNVSTIPYGRIPLPAAYSYSSIPTHYAYPSSAAYYYHPTALTSVPSIYHRPTVFNFPPVANTSPVVESVFDVPSPADSTNDSVADLHISV